MEEKNSKSKLCGKRFSRKEKQVDSRKKDILDANGEKK